MIGTHSPETTMARGGIVRVAAADLESVCTSAQSAARKRARLCAHPSPQDPLHEMLICLARSTYIRPHRHEGKSESFHIISGELDVVLFDDDGPVREVIRMGPYDSGRVFFYRLMEPRFHTVLVSTAQVLFHETTNGPFDPADAKFAPWSPGEGDPACAEFVKHLRSHIV